MDIESNNEFQNVIADAEDELIEALRNYSKTFAASSSENKGIPTINQIEDMWSKLDKETKNIFANMISGSISSVNERNLISSKKVNT